MAPNQPALLQAIIISENFNFAWSMAKFIFSKPAYITKIKRKNKKYPRALKIRAKMIIFKKVYLTMPVNC